MFRNIHQGFKSLSRHKMRTFLSTLGILFGVAAVISMLSIGEGAKREIMAQIEQLGLNTITIKQNELSDEQLVKILQQKSQGLSLSDASKLKNNVPELLQLSLMKVIEASIQGTHTSITPEVLSISPLFGTIKGLQMAEGRFVCDMDLTNKHRVCVLGSKIANDLGQKGHPTQTLRIDSVEFEIVGVLKNKNWASNKISTVSSRNFNESIFIPLGVEMGLPTVKFSPKTMTLSEITVQIKKSDHLQTAAKVIKRILEKSHEGNQDYQVIIPQELMQQAFRTQRTFNLVLGSIAAISLLVGGIGIMNIMLANVSERTHEIGIRRALGASKTHIAFQFLTESLLLTLLGAALGVIFGAGLSLLISITAEWKTIVTPWSVALSLSMSTLVGLCSGLYPALKAANMNPITALRQN